MEHFDWITGAVIPYANFAIFLFLLLKFVKKPFQNIAKKRREEYDSLFKESKRLHDEAKRRFDELNQRMSSLDKEIAEIEQSAQKTADQEAKNIVEGAERLSQHLKEEAQRIAQFEAEQARNSLREEIVSEVEQAVRGRLQTDLNENSKRDVVKKQIKKFGDVKMEVLH